MHSKQKKGGLIRQVLILFVISVLATGTLSFFIQSIRSEALVKQQIETHAGQIAKEISQCVEEYPAHEWLLTYWYEHADDLEPEYDAGFGKDTETVGKCRQLVGRHPDLLLTYADTAEIEALPEADQKLYAEIVYAWMINRINQIKEAYQVDFLFCVLTDESYESQFFMLSAADPGSVRGTEYEEVYPLGVTVTVSESQQEAMRDAQQNAGHLAAAGNYVDYYAPLTTIGDHILLTGITFNLSGLKKAILSQTLKSSAFAAGYQILLSAICMILLLFVVLRPLKKVQQNIRLYAQEKDSKAVTANLESVRPKNEIGQLSKDIVSLTHEIDDYLVRIENITAEKERISTELDLATRIQANMLPNIFPAFPDHKELDIYAVMDPAREVGGDFYDFFMIDSNHLCFLIADVSGKGIPAALLMMASKIILSNNAQTGKSPAQILADTNASIYSNNPEEMFVTVWLGILDLSTGKLTAANAGHEYPILKHPDGRFELFKDKHGFVLGGMPNMKYHEYEVQMEPGSKLFLYTDGVPEATNNRNEMFGTNRMLDALNEIPDASAEELLKHMRQAVDSFVGDAEQFDDMTMLGLEYKGL